MDLRIKKNTLNWFQRLWSWLMSYRVIRTSTEKHTAFIQEGEDLCGSRVSLETSHTGEIGKWPDPDLSRHGTRAHHGWGGEGETPHWRLMTTQGLKGETGNSIHAIIQIFWQFTFGLYMWTIYNNTRKYLHSLFQKEMWDKCECYI